VLKSSSVNAWLGMPLALIVVNVFGAHAPLNPLGTIRGDLEDRYWRTNPISLFDDFQFKESLYCSSRPEIGIPIWIRLNKPLDSILLPANQSSALRSLHRLDIIADFPIPNIVAFCDSFARSVRYLNKGSFEDYAASRHAHVENKIMEFGIVYHFNHGWVNQAVKSVDLVHETSWRRGGTEGKVENIEMRSRTQVHPSAHKVHIAKSVYLAASSIGSVVNEIIDPAVSANENPVGRAQDHHGSGKGTTAQQKYPECAYPKYLRRNDTETVTKLLSDPWMFDLDGHDFDVSCDGVEWFHLLGDYCMKTLPSFYRNRSRTIPIVP